MIDGLKLKIESDELRRHCTDRSQYHHRRAEEKAAQLPELKRSIEALEKIGAATSLASMGGKSSYAMDRQDPVEALEIDIRDHRNKSLVFSFFASHLFDDDYNLKEEDLIRLEILKRW